MAQPVDSTRNRFPLSDCAIKKAILELLSPKSIYQLLKENAILFLGDKYGKSNEY